MAGRRRWPAIPIIPSAILRTEPRRGYANTQVSHFKLWLAGNVRNWALADYELRQMSATLEDAKRLFPDVPNADTSAMMPPAQAIRDAIQAKDGAGFDRAFESFTLACDN
jgi:hypothetical protein